MLFDFEVWIAALILASPVATLVVACFPARRFHRRNNVQSQQRAIYWIALAAAFVSAIAYLSYWSWWISKTYHIEVPFTVSLWLERLMYASTITSALSLICLVAGRGPYRIVVAISVVCIAVYLWFRLPIIHWA
jgi:hypothetical protein